MLIGFVTGSLTSVGSGRAIVLPLASSAAELGHQTFGLQLARLRKGLAEIDGLRVWQEPLWPQLLASPLDLVGIVRKRLTPGSQAITSQSRLTAYQRVAAKALHRGCNRLALDVVYAFHNTNVALLLAQKPIPSTILVINLIGFGIDPSRGGAVDTFPLQKYIFSRPHWDLHVAATHFEYEQYRQVYETLGLDPSRLLYLPHPYDENSFYPNNSQAATQGTGEDEKVLLYPVNVYRRKNIELAIDVTALLSQQWAVRLVVTGRIWDQKYLRALQEQVASRGIGDRVEFLRGVPYEQLVERYREASATIFTSHQETFGHGIVQSLGSGTPVVGPNWINPCREILEASYGGYCADMDAESFAAAIDDLFRNPPEARRIAQGARRRYGNKVIAARFLRAVDKVLRQKHQYATDLYAIDWKKLYRDAGTLL